MTVKTTFANGKNPFMAAPPPASNSDADCIPVEIVVGDCKPQARKTLIRERIVDLLLKHGPMTVRQIAEKAFTSKETVAKRLTDLLEDGLVSCRITNNKNNQKTWWLTDSGYVPPPPDPPHPPKAAPKVKTEFAIELTQDTFRAQSARIGGGKYTQFFEKMIIDGGGLKVPSRNNAESVSDAMRQWIKRKGLAGRPCVQKWPDGYRIFWVSQK